jgi:hypothetical protein
MVDVQAKLFLSKSAQTGINDWGFSCAMSRKPLSHWTIEELNKIVARKFEAAKTYQPGPRRQKLLREAKRYENLLETKKWITGGLQPPP